VRTTIDPHKKRTRRLVLTGIDFGDKERTGRLDLTGIDFGDFEDHPLSLDALRSLRYQHDVEHHTVCYLRDPLTSPRTGILISPRY
jgi:hypothetical protein